MSQLDLYFNELNKKYGGQIATLGIKPKEYELLKFSSPRINYCLYGGIPKNRVIQFVGPFSSGKTTSACDIIANYQHDENAKEVIYIDNEQTFDEQWATKIGVDTQRIRLVQPEGANDVQIFQMVLDMVKTGEAGLIVVDSLATLVPEQIADEDMDKKQRGGIAASLTVFLNKIVPLLKKFECTLLLLNQVRDSMDPYKMFTIPGGKALEHHSSVIIVFSKGKGFDMNHKELTSMSPNPYGNFVSAFIYKIKHAPPDRKLGFYSLVYSKGIDAVGDTVDCAIEFNLINQRGAWFFVVNEETGEVTCDELGEPLKFQGKEKLVNYYKENKQKYDELLKEVNKRIEEKK